jgi:predicted phosphodiesterase
MKLNILSDLHLSLGALEPPRNDADVVILAGDVARPAAAVAWAARLAKPVLYVAGNHEFYGGSIDGTLGELRERCAGTRIRLLDGDVVVCDGVRFLGATLWTDFRLLGDGRRDAAMRDGQRFMRDFSRIRLRDASERMFTPEDSAALFDAHARWLARKLAEPFAGPTVVITHHAPSPMSIHPRFADSPLNACFVSDAERLIDGARACLWIHGHTHDSFDYVVNGTRIVCNPRGYARDGVNENPRFDANFCITVGARG